MPAAARHLLVLLLAGCAAERPATTTTASHPPEEVPTERTTPAPAPPEFAWQRSFQPVEPARNFAVLGQGAGLWRSPSAAEPLANLPHRTYGAVEVLGSEGDFLKVSLDWKVPSHVAQCRPPLSRLALEVFVRSDELVDVVIEAGVVDFQDGTGFNVAPGVLAVSRDDGSLRLSAYEAHFGGLAVNVPADAGLKLGKIYPAVEGPSQRFSGPREAGSVSAGGATHDYPEHGLLMAQAEHDPSHVLYGVSCLQIAGFYAPTPPPEIPVSVGGAGGGGTGSGTLGLPHGAIIGKGGPNPQFNGLYRIRAGAELTWPDGAPAGVTVREFMLQQPPERRGKRRCFVEHLDDYGPAHLDFCVAAADAELVG
ncbi:MAG: hypothetical protein KC431_07075 [Myxococcales bacterium]|nr:hypothetical protein [Myxococcales bacterium]